MRLLSRSEEEGLEADAQATAGLVVVPERELVEEDGAEQEALRRQQTAGGHAAQTAEY